MKAAAVALLVILGACTSSADPTTTITTAPAPTTTASSAPTTTAASATTAEILESLGGEPCPDSEFTCVTLEVPLDHFDASNDETIGVTFAILPAAGESRGAFVTVTGGPGTSGIAVADSYTSLYDPAIAEQFDMVFFDQRGIASSGELDCPQAAVAYFRAPGDVTSAAGINLLVEGAEAFSNACVAEMGNPELLGYVSTDQAIADLELLRQTFGWEELVLFGESYGTQFGQAYAAAYPESLDRLVIDGVVDLTLEGIAYHQEMAAASSRTLDLMLEACDEDQLCSTDFGGQAGDAYDNLYAQLLEGDLTAEFPLPDGTAATRNLSLGDLETIATGHLYEEYDRMIFLRALSAWGGEGDPVPLLRLLNINLGLDPQTQAVIEDPTWSDAMYYGVECLDYDYPGETPAEVAEAMVAAMPSPEGLRLASVYFGDLPCAFWPHTTEIGRPAPLTAEGIPVLVLGSTVDPVTPYQQGVDVHSRLADGHIMSKEGGPHVIFGWGEPCPDVEVTRFILNGTPPTTQMCEGVVIAPYQPRLTAVDTEDPETMLSDIEWEIGYFPEYYYWDGFTDTSVGCPDGGTMAFTATDVGNDFTFDGCGLATDVVMSGTGSYDSFEDVFILDVSMGECSYGYQRVGEEITVDTTCD